jgi:hypothetical protein
MSYAAKLRALVMGATVGLIASFPAFSNPDAFAGLVPSSAVGDLNGDGVPDAVVQPRVAAFS